MNTIDFDLLNDILDNDFVILSVPSRRPRPNGRRLSRVSKVVTRDTVRRAIHELAEAHVCRRHARITRSANVRAELRFFYQKFFE